MDRQPSSIAGRSNLYFRHPHALAEREGELVLAREALAVQVEVGDQLGTVESLERLASIVADSDNIERAARLVAVAGALRARLGAPVPPWADRDQQHAVELARRTVGEARYAEFGREAGGLSIEAAAEQATRGLS